MDGTSRTPDLWTALVTWVETNRDSLTGLDEEVRTKVLGCVEAVLEILETEAAPAPSADLTWTAFRDRPSAYLLPDAEALMARAALYVPEEDEALLRAFDRGDALETYLVNGQVPPHVAPVLPVVADACAEMHDHRLGEIPKEMTAYVRHGVAMTAEHEHIARIVARRSGDLSDPAALERAEADYREFQMALGEVEERIIAESTVYDRDGVARLLQDAASTAATTGRADLAGSAVGRDVLKAFVALEGRGPCRTSPVATWTPWQTTSPPPRIDG